jgi:hypothetical protein
MNLKCKKDVSLKTDGIIQIDQNSSIRFSGLTWFVKGSLGKIGPGPNYWSPKNVWVDSIGNLHLKLDENKITGQWECAEIISKLSLEYGTYQFWVEGQIDQLDKNVVLGFFNYSGNDGYDEMDIEFARWGSNTAPNLYYSVWPAYNSTSKIWTASHNFYLTSKYTTQRFIRTSVSVKFQSLTGFNNDNSNEYFTQTYSNNQAISKIPMAIHINLWLYKGKTPSNKKEIEIIIHAFKYFP